MQLKIRRSQRAGGVMGNTVFFSQTGDETSEATITLLSSGVLKVRGA